MTYFDHETDLYMEECDGEVMPRTRALRANDLIVQAYMARHGFPNREDVPDLTGISLDDILLATRIVKRMPPDRDDEGREIFLVHVADEAEIAALYTWAIGEHARARVA